MLHNFQDEVEQYGLDWVGPLPESDSDEMIELPLTECPLNLQETQELKQAIDPLRNSDCYGIDIFVFKLYCLLLHVLQHDRQTSLFNRQTVQVIACHENIDAKKT